MSVSGMQLHVLTKARVRRGLLLDYSTLPLNTKAEAQRHYFFHSVDIALIFEKEFCLCRFYHDFPIAWCVRVTGK